ncbi:hypothetical protein HMPREF0972_00894 [Actinomyces sp. oral taxon 848 str. F0332]|nr:hypothetical protein HMPREF0972_00894 [Actinomyces sp. oral taxon 848 str. F0332]
MGASVGTWQTHESASGNKGSARRRWNDGVRAFAALSRIAG